VSKGVEDGRRPPAVGAGQSCNSCKANLGMASPQGIEGLVMAGLEVTLGSPMATPFHMSNDRLLAAILGPAIRPVQG
jgi:hypothetical protein